MKRLEAVVEAHRSETAERLDALHGQVARASREIRTELARVSSEQAALRLKTSAAVAGDLGHEVVGLLWLLSGAVLSAIPSELAWLVERSLAP